MTRRKAGPPWWQLPAIIAGSVTALGVVGTGIVKTASVITLPDRLEAAERVNEQQQTAIDKLTVIQETWQQIYQQQQQPPVQQMPPTPTTRRWHVDVQRWACCDEAPATCDQAQSWYWCSE